MWGDGVMAEAGDAIVMVLPLALAGTVRCSCSGLNVNCCGA